MAQSRVRYLEITKKLGLWSHHSLQFGFQGVWVNQKVVSYLLLVYFPSFMAKLGRLK